MKEIKDLSENTYNNEVALKDLIKMMRRNEKITVSFVVDKYGYAAAKLDSKTMIEPFILQMSDDLYQWLLDYLVKGKITEPIPSANKELLESTTKDTNEFATNTLKNYIKRSELRFYMHITPEIADKPNRITVKFGFPNGIIVFKVKREQDILDELASIDF